jgi:chromosome segregation ATPase
MESATADREAATAKASSKINAQLVALQGETAALQRDLRASKALAAKLEQEAGSKERESEAAVVSLTRDLDAVRERAAGQQAEFDNLTALLKDLNAEQAQSAAEYEELHGQHKAVRRALEDSQTVTSRLRTAEEAADVERRALEADLKSVQEAVAKGAEEKRKLLASVDELQAGLGREEEERRKSGDARAELRDARGRAEQLGRELQTMKTDNQALVTRMQALSKLDEGADGLVDELIRCKMDLANAWEQIDNYKRRVKQADPALHVSPNLSGQDR